MVLNQHSSDLRGCCSVTRRNNFKKFHPLLKSFTHSFIRKITQMTVESKVHCIAIITLSFIFLLQLKLSIWLPHRNTARYNALHGFLEMFKCLHYILWRIYIYINLLPVLYIWTSFHGVVGETKYRDLHTLVETFCPYSGGCYITILNEVQTWLLKVFAHSFSCLPP